MEFWPVTMFIRTLSVLLGTSIYLCSGLAFTSTKDSLIKDYANNRHKFYSLDEIKQSLNPLAEQVIDYRTAAITIFDRPGSESCFNTLLKSDSIILCEHREPTDIANQLRYWVVVLTIKDDKVVSVNVSDSIRNFDMAKHISEYRIRNFDFSDYNSRTIAEAVLLRKHPIGTPIAQVLETIDSTGSKLRKVEKRDDGTILYAYRRPRKLFDWDGWHIRIYEDKNGSFKDLRISMDLRFVLLSKRLAISLGIF